MGLRRIAELDWFGDKKLVARITYDSNQAEYMVKFDKDGRYHEAADYFTSDKKDAIGTAFLELERMAKGK